MRISNSKGFTLMEVLVAFLILAFSLGALFRLFSGSLDAVHRGENYAHAAALARAHLATVDADGVEIGKIDAGETDDGFRWEAQVAELPVAEADSDKNELVPVQVTVTVTWGALDSKSLSLQTVRLAHR